MKSETNPSCSEQHHPTHQLPTTHPPSRPANPDPNPNPPFPASSPPTSQSLPFVPDNASLLQQYYVSWYNSPWTLLLPFRNPSWLVRIRPLGRVIWQSGRRWVGPISNKKGQRHIRVGGTRWSRVHLDQNSPTDLIDKLGQLSRTLRSDSLYITLKD